MPRTYRRAEGPVPPDGPVSSARGNPYIDPAPRRLPPRFPGTSHRTAPRELVAGGGRRRARAHRRGVPRRRGLRRDPHGADPQRPRRGPPLSRRDREPPADRGARRRGDGHPRVRGDRRPLVPGALHGRPRQERQALSRLVALAGDTPGDESLPADLAIVQTGPGLAHAVRRARHRRGAQETRRADRDEPRERRAGPALRRRPRRPRTAGGGDPRGGAGRERLADAVRNLVVALVVIGVALVLSAIAFAVVLRRAISDPLARLSGDVRQVARGDLAAS